MFPKAIKPSQNSNSNLTMLKNNSKKSSNNLFTTNSIILINCARSKIKARPSSILGLISSVQNLTIWKHRTKTWNKNFQNCQKSILSTKSYGISHKQETNCNKLKKHLQSNCLFLSLKSTNNWFTSMKMKFNVIIKWRSTIWRKW